MQISIGKGSSYANYWDYFAYHCPMIIRIIILILVILLLARPQYGQSFNVSKHKGVDIMLVLDTSESMSALDLDIHGKTTTRLEVLKSIMKDFTSKRENDRIGLVVFGEDAYTQCPLTIDHGTILDMVSHLEIGMAGGATAIGSGLGLAVKRLEKSEAKSKIIVLMTDGVNNAGTIAPETVAEIAKELNIKIYTIGIGQDGEVPFLVNTPQGQIMIKQEIPIDEESLANIARTTQGEYFRARSTENIQGVYAHINKLYKSEFKTKQYDSYKDLYEPLLYLAFVFFLVELWVANTIFFRIF